MIYNMEKSEDSDSEFWIEIDKKIILNKPEAINPESAKPLPIINDPSLEEKTNEYIATAPNAYYRERFQYLINQVRTAAKAQSDNELSITKRLLQKEHEQKVSELKLLHRDQINDLRKEFKIIKDKLVEAIGNILERM